MRRAWAYIAGVFGALLAAIALLWRRNSTLRNELNTSRDEKELARTTERKEAATLKFQEAYDRYKKTRAKYDATRRDPNKT